MNHTIIVIGVIFVLISISPIMSVTGAGTYDLWKKTTGAQSTNTSVPVNLTITPVPNATNSSGNTTSVQIMNNTVPVNQTVLTPISIPYDSLLNNAESHKGETYTVSGYVSQTVDASDYVKQKGLGTNAQGVELWVNYDDCISGLSSNPQMLQLYVVDRPLGRDVVKGDRITVTCVALNLYTYEGSGGVKRTIPSAGVKSGKIN